MAIYARLHDRSSLRESSEGVELSEVWRVTELTGNPGRRLHDALTAPGVPPMSQPHSDIPGIVALSRTVEPVSADNTKFDVRVTFGVPSSTDLVDDTAPYGPATWRISARTAQLDILDDVHGDRMRIIYDGKPVTDYYFANTAETVAVQSNFRYTIHRVHQARVERPILFLEATRWERENPEQTLRAHHGAVNRETWRGYPPKTVLLTDVGANESNGGYEVTYGFSVNREQWVEVATIEIYNQIPQDAYEGNGIKTFEIYPTAQFATLGLSE